MSLMANDVKGDFIAMTTVEPLSDDTIHAARAYVVRHSLGTEDRLLLSAMLFGDVIPGQPTPGAP